MVGKLNFAAKKPDNEEKGGRWSRMLDIYAKIKRKKRQGWANRKRLVKMVIYLKTNRKRAKKA